MSYHIRHILSKTCASWVESSREYIPETRTAEGQFSDVDFQRKAAEFSKRCKEFPWLAIDGRIRSGVSSFHFLSLRSSRLCVKTFSISNFQFFPQKRRIGGENGCCL